MTLFDRSNPSTRRRGSRYACTYSSGYRWLVECYVDPDAVLGSNQVTRQRFTRQGVKPFWNERRERFYPPGESESGLQLIRVRPWNGLSRKWKRFGPRFRISARGIWNERDSWGEFGRIRADLWVISGNGVWIMRLIRENDFNRVITMFSVQWL